MSGSCDNPRRHRRADTRRPNPVSSGCGGSVAVRNPSAAPPTASAPPATAPAPSASTSAPLAPPSAAPAPPSAAPQVDRLQRRVATRGVTRRQVGKRTVAQGERIAALVAPRHSKTIARALSEDIIPERIRRKSHVAGPCIHGVGGCAGAVVNTDLSAAPASASGNAALWSRALSG